MDPGLAGAGANPLPCWLWTEIERELLSLMCLAIPQLISLIWLLRPILSQAQISLEVTRENQGDNSCVHLLVLWFPVCLAAVVSVDVHR